MSGLFGSTSTNTANTLGDLSKDVMLNQGPEDSISDIAFSPQSEHLAVSSWDKKVRIYEVNDSGGEGKALFEHEGPVLSCDWSKVCNLLLHSPEIHYADLQSGWHQGRWRRGGQSCSDVGPWFWADGGATSRCSRSAHPVRPVFRGASIKCGHACHWLLG